MRICGERSVILSVSAAEQPKNAVRTIALLAILVWLLEISVDAFSKTWHKRTLIARHEPVSLTQL